MADVVTVLVSGETVHNGYSVFSAQQIGNYDSLSVEINPTQTPAEFDSQLGDRFDDKTYYTS